MEYRKQNTMKINTFGLLLVALLLNSVSVNAQKGIEDGSRFGHGEDSIRSVRNMARYQALLKENDFKKAYAPWKMAFTETPWAQTCLYTDGTRILRALITGSKSETEEKGFLKELMAVHDQRIHYLDSLNTLTDAPVSPGFILGMKAHDYLMFAPLPLDTGKAYRMVQKAIGMEKEKSTYYMLQDIMDLSLQQLKNDPDHIEQFIQDYLTASHHANMRIKTLAPDTKKRLLWETTKNYIDARFMESGQTTCKALQAVYGPKIERHQTDLAYLNQVLTTLEQLKCTGEEAYIAASEAVCRLTPTYGKAARCGYLYYKKGETEKSIAYFDKAIELAGSTTEQSTSCYWAARVLFNQKQWIRAKQYALKAIALNPNNGKPYILIAQMYASNPNWCKEATLNQCTYFAVIDKLQKAKSVDASVTDEANRLINTYTAHIPSEHDLAYLGLKKGNSVILGGWIDETIILR